MVAAFEGNSQYWIGTESVFYRAVDTVDPQTVDNVLPGKLSYAQVQLLGTLGIGGEGRSFLLDAADLAGTVPARGGRIDQADGSKWRIQAIDYSQISKVYACVCTKDEA